MDLAGSLVRRAGPPAFFFFCLLLYGRQTIVKVLPMLSGPSDFRVYQQAALQLVEGRSPFTVVGYIYPPLLAMLLTPIARLDYLTARWCWFLFSQACLVTAAGLLWRSLGRDWIALCVVAFVWAVGGSAFENLYLGQIGPELTLLLAFGYTGTLWTQAGALGIGSAVKILPGVASVPLLLARQWRTLARMTLWAILLTAIPWLIVIQAFPGPRKPAGIDFLSGTPAILSWSVPSVVLRAMDRPTEGMPLPRDWETGNDLPNLRLPFSHRLASATAALVTFLSGTVAFIIVTRGKLCAGQLPSAIAAFVALALAAAPVGWTHYQVLQYPAVALMLCHAWRNRRWKLVAVVLSCGALLYPLPVAVLTRYYYQRGGSWAPAAPVTLFFWTSLTPLASIGLFLLLTRVVREQTTSAARHT